MSSPTQTATCNLSGVSNKSWNELPEAVNASVGAIWLLWVATLAHGPSYCNPCNCKEDCEIKVGHEN